MHGLQVMICAPEKISKTSTLHTRIKFNVRSHFCLILFSYMVYIVSYKITNNHMCMVVGVILYTTYDHKYYVQIYKIKYTGYWWSRCRSFASTYIYIYIYACCTVAVLMWYFIIRDYAGMIVVTTSHWMSIFCKLVNTIRLCNNNINILFTLMRCVSSCSGEVIIRWKRCPIFVCSSKY